MEATPHPRLRAWWTDDAADPGRLPADWPDVARLVAQVAPGASATDLGGVFSLNVRLEPHGLVLRVHQPASGVSRTRLLGLQAVRRALASRGLHVPVALPWRGESVLLCGSRWAELEPYLPSERLEPSPDSYRWLYGAMGTLHRALADTAVPVPRPTQATFAPPTSVLRWLPVTEAAVASDPEARELASLVRALALRVRLLWVPARSLPEQWVHGDVRLSNVRRGPSGAPVYFDFGFLARRPRVHDLAYALAFMVWSLDCLDDPDRFPWDVLPRLLEAYEAAAHSRLTRDERAALLPYAAAVPLHGAALDGFTEDPAGKVRARAPFVRLAEWMLAHPEVLEG